MIRSDGMNCGECLMNDVKIVQLVGGVCPVCQADYRPPRPPPPPDEPSDVDQNNPVEMSADDWRELYSDPDFPDDDGAP